ncbi:MAG: sugar ABC transporter permease, partial [Eggerthellaceae bacterium]|nr:sugar ABC transporter permease [Eggerthellaceae bacterium]
MAVKNSIRTATRRWSPLFLGPVVAAFIIGFVWPFLQGIYLSFCSFKTTSNAQLIGFGNYVEAFADASFQHSFWYTAATALVSLILINVLAFLIAYMLTQSIKGANIFRTVFFMPNLIGGIVLGYIWSMIFDGILAAYNTSILLNTTYGFWGLIILMCWQQIGYMMIIYIAGLQAVPEDMLEAAKIDGAGKWQTLFKVVIPNVMPAITICMFLSLTNGFKLFDPNLALTGGLPFIIQPDGSTINTT